MAIKISKINPDSDHGDASGFSKNVDYSLESKGSKTNSGCTDVFAFIPDPKLTKTTCVNVSYNVS